MSERSEQMLKERIEKEIKKIKEDKSSGASEFTEKALEIFEAQLQLVRDGSQDITEEIHLISREIIEARPSMALLMNIVGYLIGSVQQITSEKLNERMRQFRSFRNQKQSALESNFVRFIKENAKNSLRVMTISYSSTLINLFSKIKDYDIEFYVLESRPLFEGRRTAQILSKSYKTNLIVDAAMGYFMEEMDFILFGIDSILRDGSIINKIGTYPLSVLAQSKLKGVYAVGDSFKYNLKSHYGREVKIEQKSSKEVYQDSANNSLNVHNYYFDLTPSNYIRGIISDLGVNCPSEFISKVKESLALEWFEPFLKE